MKKRITSLCELASILENRMKDNHYVRKDLDAGMKQLGSVDSYHRTTGKGVYHRVYYFDGPYSLYVCLEQNTKVTMVKAIQTDLLKKRQEVLEEVVEIPVSVEVTRATESLQDLDTDPEYWAFREDRWAEKVATFSLDNPVDK